MADIFFYGTYRIESLSVRHIWRWENSRKKNVYKNDDYHHLCLSFETLCNNDIQHQQWAFAHQREYEKLPASVEHGSCFFLVIKKGKNMALLIYSSFPLRACIYCQYENKRTQTILRQEFIITSPFFLCRCSIEYSNILLHIYVYVYMYIYIIAL